MIIEQTIEIPDDRRILFEILAPKEIPTGRARVELKFTPVIENQGRPVPEKRSIDQATPRADRLLGIALRNYLP